MVVEDLMGALRFVTLDEQDVLCSRKMMVEEVLCGIEQEIADVFGSVCFRSVEVYPILCSLWPSKSSIV